MFLCEYYVFYDGMNIMFFLYYYYVQGKGKETDQGGFHL